MNDREALKYLKDFIDHNPEIGDYNMRVLKKAADALEYRVSKKPFIILDTGEDGYSYPTACACDNCGNVLDADCDFCPYCGQAIDWCDESGADMRGEE